MSTKRIYLDRPGETVLGSWLTENRTLIFDSRLTKNRKNKVKVLTENRKVRTE